MARFVDQCGLAVDGDDGFIAHAYDSPSGPAVIAAACGAKAKGRVTVTRDAFTATGQPSAGLVSLLDGSQTAHEDELCEFELGENELAVWAL